MQLLESAEEIMTIIYKRVRETNHNYNFDLYLFPNRLAAQNNLDLM